MADSAASIDAASPWRQCSVPPMEPGSKRAPSPVWIAAPTAPGPRKRAVIVLHEWWGVTPGVKAQALEWLSQDFVVCVLDLYRGQVASNVEEASYLMQALDFTQAIRDIGLVGFSLGGCLALAAAVHLHTHLDAAVVFYGIPDSRFATPTKVAIPTQLHFGEDDQLPGFSDPTSQASLEKQLQSSSAVTEFFRYPSCGHSFAAPVGHTDPEEIKATIRARERTREFFRARLV